MKTLAALAVTATTLSPTLALGGPDRPTARSPSRSGRRSSRCGPTPRTTSKARPTPSTSSFPAATPGRSGRPCWPSTATGRRPSVPGPVQLHLDRRHGLRAGGVRRDGGLGGRRRDPARLRGRRRSLGNPFRFHIRLFAQGGDTLGNAHFEFLIPGTAEHEVLSWDLARAFVTLDVARTGALTASPPRWRRSDDPRRELPGGGRRPVYDGLVAGGAIPILAAAGLYPTSVPAGVDMPIPTNGAAAVLAAEIIAVPTGLKALAETDVTYDIVIPRPFCSTGPVDLGPVAGPIPLRPSHRDDAFGPARAHVHPRRAPHPWHPHGPRARAGASTRGRAG